MNTLEPKFTLGQRIINVNTGQAGNIADYNHVILYDVISDTGERYTCTDQMFMAPTDGIMSRAERDEMRAKHTPNTSQDDWTLCPYCRVPGRCDVIKALDALDLLEETR